MINYILLSSLLTWLFIRPTSSASIIGYYLMDDIHENNLGEGRIFWGPLGDFIESSTYFPITINVPDVLAGIGNMMSNVYDYFFGGSSSTQSEDVGTAHNVNHPRFRSKVQKNY